MAQWTGLKEQRKRRKSDKMIKLSYTQEQAERLNMLLPSVMLEHKGKVDIILGLYDATDHAIPIECIFQYYNDKLAPEETVVYTRQEHRA